MAADPKAVAKASAKAKDVKKKFEDAHKASGAAMKQYEDAMSSVSKALAKMKMDGDIKDGDFSVLAKETGALQKAIVAIRKSENSMENLCSELDVSFDDLIKAQHGK